MNMEDRSIINLWKSYDQRLEASLSLNHKNFAEITGMKVQTLLGSMKPIKIFTILVGLIWVGFVDFILLNSWEIASPFFLVSAGIQVLLTKVAIIIYVYQLILLDRVDLTEPVCEVQATIARLKSSTLWVTRLLLLQLPVWTTFYWHESMFQNGNTLLWAVQILVTAAFIGMAIWLFLNIKMENHTRKWFNLIFKGKEWTPLLKSLALLEQVAEYKDGGSGVE